MNMTTDATSALRACPFCGCSPLSQWYGSNTPGAEDCGYWGIDCCVVHVHCDTEAEAVEIWNRRATLTADAADGVQVPREPTPEMLMATGPGSIGLKRRIWQIMYDAYAATPPTGGEQPRTRTEGETPRD